MLTVLQALAHAPMGLVELAILTNHTVDEVADQLSGLQSLPVGMVDDDQNVWHITELGWETIELTEECNRLQRRDAACQGVGNG